MKLYRAAVSYECTVTRDSHERQANGLMLRILTSIEELKETQRIHGSMLQSILRRMNEQHDQHKLPSDVALPLRSLKELRVFEEKAKEKIFCDAMVSFCWN